MSLPDSICLTKGFKYNGFLLGSSGSGSDEGAHYGPSLMPGGSIAAWQSIKQGIHSIQELALKLRKARQIVLLIKAGTAVDDFIKQLEAFLAKGNHQWQSIKQGAYSIQELASKLRKARKIVLLIKASP
jgi:6-phosphogluconate dehydrogenase